MKKDDVIIRPVRVSDAEELHAIKVQPEVVRGTYTLPSERPSRQRERIEGLGRGVHEMVAVLGGKVVGFASLFERSGKMRHSGSIGIFVDQRHKGQGIGTKLMQSLIDIADNYLMLKRMELTVVEDNVPAIGLYKKFGFEVEGTHKYAMIRDGQYVNTLTMARCKVE